MIKSTTHRTLFYWLLLLIPTLAAALGALWLLHREQLRIDEHARTAIEARKIAVNDRAHLIAENIEVLVIDIQSGLMSTLMEAPSDEPFLFLTNWKKANALVRDVFQSTDDGYFRWGATNNNVSSWLLTTPWNKKQTDFFASKSIDENSEKKIALSMASLSEEIASPQIVSNAIQYQSQRSIAKKMSAQKSLPLARSKMAEVVLQEPQKDISETIALADIDIDIASEIDTQKSKQPIAQNGWTPWFDNENKLHIFGWRICPNDSVLVVEIDMQSLEKQLEQMLPQIIPENESYFLRRADGSIVSQVGRIENNFLESKTFFLNKETTTLLSTQILPNWAITGSFIIDDDSIGNGQKFFLTSSVLVVIFVFTILAGGSLLLRQARISEKESLQKTSFVANVSHELKTPLTSIRLHAELLAENRVRDEEQRNNFLNAIGRETQRLTRLVNNVLDFSRLEQGRRKLSLANIDIIHELNTILDCHTPRIESAGLELIRNFSEKEFFINTDSDALGQIIINLIDNACKYASSGKELEISLNQIREKNIKISVADRGLGIPDSHRKRIFEKFHRIDNSLTAEQGGTGLGLSIAYQLALSLGGDLLYEKRENGGSKFTLILPYTSKKHES